MTPFALVIAAVSFVPAFPRSSQVWLAAGSIQDTEHRIRGLNILERGNTLIEALKETGRPDQIVFPKAEAGEAQSRYKYCIFEYYLSVPYTIEKGHSKVARVSFSYSTWRVQDIYSEVPEVKTTWVPDL